MGLYTDCLKEAIQL